MNTVKQDRILQLVQAEDTHATLALFSVELQFHLGEYVISQSNSYWSAGNPMT
jgi:hypothetical protein